MNFQARGTRSTDPEAVELPIMGFSIVIYHCCDAEVGGPLKEPLNDYPGSDVSTSSEPALQRSCRTSQGSRRARAPFLLPTSAVWLITRFHVQTDGLTLYQ